MVTDSDAPRIKYANKELDPNASPTTTRAASVVSPGTVSYAGVHTKVPLAKAVQAGSVDTEGAMLSIDYIWKDFQG